MDDPGSLYLGLDDVKVLLAAGAGVNDRDDEGRTPLTYAARWSPVPAVIQVLTAAGGDVNQKDQDGMTALLWAARESRNPDIVSTLLEAGPTLESRAPMDGQRWTWQGRTPG